MALEVGRLSEKNAMEVYLNSDNTQLHALKQELQRAQEEAANSQAEVEKFAKKMRALEDRHRESEDDARKSHLQEQEVWKKEKNGLEDEIRKYRRDLSEVIQDRDARERENNQLKLMVEKSEY